MANKRNLKKDVNFLTDEFMSDSFALLSLYEGHDEEILTSMRKLATARNSFIHAIQNSEFKRNKMNPQVRKTERTQRTKAVKKQISNDFQSFINEMNEAYKVLGSLSSEKE